MSTKSLHILVNEINLSRLIRLTMNHTSVPEEQEKDQCDCEPKSAIPFLDTFCSIKEGRVDTDLYKKPTDKKKISSSKSRQSLPFQGHLQ